MCSELVITQHLPLHVGNILINRLCEKQPPLTPPHSPTNLLGAEELEMVLPSEESDILADQISSTAITTRCFFSGNSE